MSDPFLGQIMITPYSFAPKNFAQCNGQTLPIAQNQALFALLGVRYGGNGQTTFMLPDLRSRTPIGQGRAPDGTNYGIGQSGGTENVTLLESQLPAHLHGNNFSTAEATSRNPTHGLFGNTGDTSLYAPGTGPQVPLTPGNVLPAGGSLPHPNMQPYTVLNFCIALTGIFPSRN